MTSAATALSPSPFVHVTTVHPRHDVRIYHKEAKSLRRLGGRSVYMIVADGLGDVPEAPGDVGFIDLGALRTRRLSRAVLGNIRVFQTVRRLKPAVVHFHDPELILMGLALKPFGYKVVYDIHEDVPKQVMNKYWIPALLRTAVSYGVSAFERLAKWSFDGFIPTTSIVAAKFPSDRTVVVHNYPDPSELMPAEPVPYAERPPHFAYIGGISVFRGACEMIDAVDLLNQKFGAKLELAGSMEPANYEDELRRRAGWSKVIYHGLVDRPAIARLLGSTRAGLVTLQPTPAHVALISIKMFEYMAAGLPVIASDFPLWRKIIGDAECGFLVDPTQPAEIAKALTWVLENPEAAEAMGRRGQKAVAETYNWDSEAKKLVGLYEALLSGRAPASVK